jgi:catechol 2,3-dioxygenase-like lactoylglutathione lyase family enzyme
VGHKLWAIKNEPSAFPALPRRADSSQTGPETAIPNQDRPYTRLPEISNVLESVTPFFIVDDLPATLDFYQSKLGFAILHKGGGDQPSGDFWAMVTRDRVMLMFKAIAPDIHPQPNSARHPWAAWDAYVLTTDPDELYTEFLAKNVPISRQLANTNDGLRAFEITDNNGYVLCFGRPNA